MIFDEYGYLELREYKLKQVSTDISTHYNDSFGKINGKIGDFLETEKSGLVMLYGKSGTGKTSYVRYLINKFDRKFIYLPAEMVGGLSRPMFLPFLAENPNSIYIIEDCEELLMQRTKGANTNNALLNLLNITDGLIGDGIAVKFICIFNSPIKNIDSALLRKGRLVTEYEFKELAPEKANKLASVENLSVPEFTRPVTLSEIYHYDGSPESNPDSKIGFNF
jgi:SpoVK/Ycf46/Vps4 family AAA+-type ATPase